MTRFKPQVALAIGGLALIAALAPAPWVPAQDKGKDKIGQLKELADARSKVCERMLDYYQESLKAPPAPGDAARNPAERYAAGYEPIELWSSRLVNARLDGAATPDERIAILEGEVQRINKFAAELKDIARNEPEWRVVADRGEFYRLAAEFRLAKEKAGR